MAIRASDDVAAFGPLLRRFRLAANLSQEALAERARISKESISTLERGTRRAPRARTFRLLADALELTPLQHAEFESAAAASTVPHVRRNGRASPGAEQRQSWLPLRHTSFVGRERECAQLAAMTAVERCVTLWGSGGIGKTRLAIEFMHAHGAPFSDGRWFVELAPLADADDIAGAIAAALGIAQQRDASLIETIIARLVGVRGLIVLDNAEHVVDACAATAERFLRELPDITIVCTSREPLRIAGERVFALEPLPIPQRDDPQLIAAPAVRLFIERAASAGVQLAGAADVREIVTICERLDAIPLALELAAARAPIMSTAEIVRGLDERFRLLTVAPRGTDPRHRTLAATLDWSTALLTPSERIVLRRLAAWPSAFTMDDAVAVAAFGEVDRWTTIDAVGRLVERSLVLATDVPGTEKRFHLLQTTHAYALECQRAAGERAAGERLQAERSGVTVAAACHAWRAGDDASFRKIDLAALRAALRWSITAQNDLTLGAAIAGDSAMYWQFVGMEVEGMRWIDAAIAALAVLDDEPLVLANAYIGRARLARRLRLHREAFDAAARAKTIAARHDDRLQCAIATLLMGDPAAIMGRPDEARAYIERAAQLFDDLGDARGRLAALWELAFLAFRTERYAEARDGFATLLKLHRERGQIFVATQAAINLADAEFSLGKTHEAIARGYEALAMARDGDATLMIVATLQNLAGYLLDDGKLAEAVGCARESLTIALAADLQVYIGFGLGHLADARARSGDLPDAALVAGYVERFLTTMGADGQATELRGYRRMMEQLDAAPNRDELADLRREGAQLDEDEALEIALSDVDVDGWASPAVRSSRSTS
jgi:predicted ATPase/transcriptional regulator with XRE-family HTH domain